MIKINMILITMVNLAFTLRSILIVGNTTPTIYSSVKNSKLSLEHVYPKCYMYKKHYNDAHNIFKCDSYINNMRSNYKYVDKLAYLNLLVFYKETIVNFN